jgi:hypothetical protein
VSILTFIGAALSEALDEIEAETGSPQFDWDDLERRVQPKLSVNREYLKQKQALAEAGVTDETLIGVIIAPH